MLANGCSCSAYSKSPVQSSSASSTSSRAGELPESLAYSLDEIRVELAKLGVQESSPTRLMAIKEDLDCLIMEDLTSVKASTSYCSSSGTSRSYDDRPKHRRNCQRGSTVIAHQCNNQNNPDSPASALESCTREAGKSCLVEDLSGSWSTESSTAEEQEEEEHSQLESIHRHPNRGHYLFGHLSSSPDNDYDGDNQSNNHFSQLPRRLEGCLAESYMKPNNHSKPLPILKLTAVLTDDQEDEDETEEEGKNDKQLLQLPSPRNKWISPTFDRQPMSKMSAPLPLPGLRLPIGIRQRYNNLFVPLNTEFDCNEYEAEGVFASYNRANRLPLVSTENRRRGGAAVPRQHKQPTELRPTCTNLNSTSVANSAFHKKAPPNPVRNSHVPLKHQTSGRTDPVSMFHAYQRQWRRQARVEEIGSRSLRWSVKAAMMVKEVPRLPSATSTIVSARSQRSCHSVNPPRWLHD